MTRRNRIPDGPVLDGRSGVGIADSCAGLPVERHPEI